jgi:hypothetical protein
MIMKQHIIILCVLLSACELSTRSKIDPNNENHADDLLLQSFKTQESERSVLDSLYDDYWQQLADKKYDMDDYKIRPDFGLELPALLNQCDTITNQLIQLYDEVSDYSKVYQKILSQLYEEEIDVDERTLNIIQTNLEQLELRNHGISNAKSFLHLYNAQLKVKIMELLRKQDLQSEKIKSLLMKAQKDYEAVYDSAFYSSHSDYANSVYMPLKRKIDELNNARDAEHVALTTVKQRSASKPTQKVTPASVYSVLDSSFFSLIHEGNTQMREYTNLYKQYRESGATGEILEFLKKITKDSKCFKDHFKTNFDKIPRQDRNKIQSLTELKEKINMQ